ncbi:hypothetical protein M885DRAFT_325318 [Pelagophyceae sp. CCMP2097]|nr:hypothetical protein M885DRAFT_325318 [Pelagophyceae sp. CCMP2097]
MCAVIAQVMCSEFEHSFSDHTIGALREPGRCVISTGARYSRGPSTPDGQSALRVSVLDRGKAANRQCQSSPESILICRSARAAAASFCWWPRRRGSRGGGYTATARATGRRRGTCRTACFRYRAVLPRGLPATASSKLGGCISDLSQKARFLRFSDCLENAGLCRGFHWLGNSVPPSSPGCAAPSHLQFAGRGHFYKNLSKKFARFDSDPEISCWDFFAQKSQGFVLSKKGLSKKRMS